MRPFPRCLALLGLSFLLLTTGVAQSGKTFFKEGESFRKEQQLEKALERYRLAIEVDPGMVKAYNARAEVLELLGRQQDALADRIHIAGLEPGDAEHAAAAARLAQSIGACDTALHWCAKALALDPKHMMALQTKVRCCLAVGDLDGATEASDKALGVKETTDTYYLHGLARMAVRDHTRAETDLEKVIEWNRMYEDAYVALAEVQLALLEQYSGPTMQMRALDKAVAVATTALDLNPQSANALEVRSRALAQQKEYARAIDDISRVVALGRTTPKVFGLRANYYQAYGQYQNAINDLNRVLLAEPDNVEALQQRSVCKEANLDMEGALQDLKKAQKAMEASARYGPKEKADLEASRARIAAIVFEMNRESDAPRITVLEPFRKEGDLVQVSSALRYVKVSGYVRDKSLLKRILVNGVEAGFAEEEKDPEFVVTVPLETADMRITVEATDLYDNRSSITLNVERTEGLAPAIVVTSPISTGDRQITVMEGREDVFVEGIVSDSSLIRSITVDGINASYAPDKLDPDFSIKVPVKGKEHFVVRAEDQFGNTSEATYTLAWKAEPVAAAKPAPDPAKVTTPVVSRSSTTGVTWLVQIENNDYKSFPGLPGADAEKLRKAFSNYSVQRTITKKNMSKEQMERFFNVELRDLVRSNKVNTVLIWYSGHGRNTSGKAYWVPVDARKDDIYSYFNYGSLKAQMQNYSESVSNTVVVSDAAGTEASFYELTR